MEEMNTVPKKAIALVFVCGSILLPGLVSASSISIHTDHSEFFEGDTILFSVRVDSDGKSINAVEGEVQLDHEVDVASLTDINTSGSSFSIWPGKPLPSERNTRISFAGGSPGGFASKDATVFNIVLKLHKAGQIALSPNNIAVYLHDGKGTRDDVRVNDLVVSVLPKKPGAKATDDWSAITSSDTTAPEPFEIYVGQDDSVSDGKKFLSFSTTDGQSGVSYYEVVEGNLPPIRSNGTYVLYQQERPEKVIVTAYDAAGNARESVYSPAPAQDTASYRLVMILIGSLLLMAILAVKVYRKMRRTRA